MTDTELILALRSLPVETGSLACLGCKHEQDCGIHGCAIMRDAAALLERDAQPNDPLTLTVLREMDGEPVWNETTKEWMLINLADGRALNSDGLWRSLDDRYYRSKPEGGWE